LTHRFKQTKITQSGCFFAVHIVQEGNVLLPRHISMLLGLSLVGSGCGSTATQTYSAPQTTPDYRAWSLQLKEGMTEDTVLHTLGAPPTKVELKTCGQDLGKPWQCKSWGYGGLLNNLTIFFQKQADNLWRVNSWTVR
jgi:hypothetical protein